MKVVVESWKKEFQRLKPMIQKTALKLGRFLGIKDGYVEIYLVSGNFMNKNVLAFPFPKNFPSPDMKQEPLGEIYLNPDYIKKNNENLIYMLIHGFLHLLGYDHKKKSDIIKMEKKEIQLLKLLGY